MKENIGKDNASLSQYKIINSDRFNATEQIVKEFNVENISTHGGNNYCAIVKYDNKDYAVLKSSNIELYKTKEKESSEYYEELLRNQNLNFKNVMNLTHKHICHNAVPILGFIYFEHNINHYSTSAYAKGFIVQPKAKGNELYKGIGWCRKDKPNEVQTVIDCTRQYSQIPPKHFANFLINYYEISKDLLIDPSKSSNFFYDANSEFSFIDLNFTCKSQLSLQDCARYILAQFRPRLDDEIKNNLDEDVVKGYENDFVNLHKNIYNGFICAGLSNEQCKEIFSNDVYKTIKTNEKETDKILK